MNTKAIIVAGGKSERFNSQRPKQFADILGKPLLAWTIEKFQHSKELTAIVVVVPEKFIKFTKEEIVEKYQFDKVTKVIAGGKTRAESVYTGLLSLSQDTDLVAIHDSVRAIVDSEDIKRVIESATKADGAILAGRVTDTIKQVNESQIEKTVNRSQLFLAQTPQVFKYRKILGVHKKLNESGYEREFTDDSSMMEENGFTINLIESKHFNFKVTTKEDLSLLKSVMKNKMEPEK